MGSMDAETVQFLDDAFERSIKDHMSITREDIVRMLSLDPESEECEYMGKKARELARKRSGNKASVGTAFGLDYRACKASCNYCSFGERWGLMDGFDIEMSPEEIIGLMKSQISRGYRKFTIRTTECYPVDRLCGLAKTIHSEIKEKFMLGVNTGELSPEDLVKLHEAGYNSAYHTLHLREGIDTPFSPPVRLRTMKNISDSEMKLSSSIDPIGSEHTDDEIADVLITIREFDPVSICSMKRINPKGTPVGDIPEVSDLRIAQIAAVIRFASGRNVSAVPPNRKAMEWGANETSVGTGANPRDSKHNPSSIGEWRFNHDDVRKMFIECGYDIAGN